MDDLKVAAVCMNAAPGEVEKNLDRIESFVYEASAQQADIICFPEFSVTGYTLKRLRDITNKLDSKKAIERLVRMAQEAHLVIISGLIETSEGEKPYITQIIVGPEGVLGLHRKTHLSPLEKDFYQAGKEIKVFSCSNTTFGLQLCYEAHFPELTTIMALKGADVIFAPHASPRGDPQGKLQSWLRHLPARSFDNSVFLVACNQVGKTNEGFSFPGVVFASGPDGRILARYAGDEEKIIFTELKADLLQDVRQHRMKYFLPHRKPELYDRLIEN
jgi:N-carbamoylputrescine amidase